MTKRILQVLNKLGDVKPDHTVRTTQRNSFEDVDHHLKSAAGEFVLVQVASMVAFYPDKAR